MDHVLKSVAQQNTDKYYREEKEINEQFNAFVTNYQIAYEGPNTLKGQIDARVKNANKRRKLTQVLSSLLSASQFIRESAMCVIKNAHFLGYSDFLDENMRRPGPEYLPLGRTFQNHIKCFTR